MADKPMRPRIAPSVVRYIKLGSGGIWEQDCLNRGIVRFGFDTGDSSTLQQCLDGRWDELRDSWIAHNRTPGTATRFTNEARIFFEDPGTTLWVTFMGERLCWGFLTPESPKSYGDQDSSWRSVVGGWCSTDIFGEELTKSRLSGAITKLAAYRGTSCSVDVEKQLVARINGEKTPDIERAIASLSQLRESLVPLIQRLGPGDFEILVDLTFSASGWRRVGAVGGKQRTLDIDLELPSTKERAFVQVKSRTNQKQFDDYVAIKHNLDTYDKMFYVYHTGSVKTSGRDVISIDARGLAEMAINAGLADWIIQKAS